MENKKSNMWLIVTIVVLVMLLLFGSTLLVLSSMGYVNFSKNDISEETNNTVIDYSKLVGLYVSSEDKTVDEIRNTGGVVLNIYSISETAISFDIESISSSQRIAKSEKADIEVTNIENNIYSFNWKNDGWNNTGNGSIVVKDEEVFLNVSTTKISDDNITGWSLGNFSNQKMLKVKVVSSENTEAKEENVNDKDNEIINNNDNTSLLTNDEALNISKELVKKYFGYTHALGPYCGQSNGQDYLSFGSYETHDFRDYSASTKFKSINELKNYFATFMVQDLFPNYLSDGVSYLEQDGKLYCQLSHKGPGETYNENKSTYNIKNIEKEKIEIDVVLVSDVVENVINTREGVVEIVRNSEGKWLISKYDVMISKR